ncbi:MAG: nitroreductase family protein [Promethearchaeota archaeon]
MDIEDVIYKRRTIRRFKQTPITLETLRKLIDYARVAPMGNNIQSLEYLIINTQENREKIFPCLVWAGSLPPEERIPEEKRRPMAYIIVCVNTKIKKNANVEIGGAIENILLGALNFGLGSCWMGAINRNKIREIFEIPNFYEISHVISLGVPDEESQLEIYNNSFKYWKKDNKMHVPKRSLDNIIIREI